MNRYITSFLEDAKQLIQQEAGGEGNSGLIELSLLVIHCIEVRNYFVYFVFAFVYNLS